MIYRNHPIHGVRSAGTAPSARIKVTAKLLQWADLVFAMEHNHKERLIENFPFETANKSIIVLGILDDYHFMDAELIDILKSEVSSYLDAIENDWMWSCLTFPFLVEFSEKNDRECDEM